VLQEYERSENSGVEVSSGTSSGVGNLLAVAIVTQIPSSTKAT
jgi:hypothetical protein